MTEKAKFVYFIIFSLIITLFLFTRLYKITEIPSSLYWDEASIGYNAYSVAETGRDEWGEAFPVHFRSFGEFKLPVYIYSVAFLTKIFGMSEYIVRLPAVFYSLGLLLVVNFIVLKLFKNKWLGILSMLFLTTSPWLFLFSRAGYEATAGIFFFAISFYLLLISLDRRNFFIFSVICLIISFYSYNSFRIIAPISFLIFSFIYYQKHKQISKTKIYILVSFAIFAITLYPFYRLVKQDFGLSRLSAVQEKSTAKIFTNYISHFTYNFLLKSGDTNPRSHVPGSGQVWVSDLILVILGFFYILKKREKIYLLIFIMFIISFIPSAITKEAPHSLRSLASIVPISVMWTIGVNFFTVSQKRYSRTIIIGLILVTNFHFFKYFGNFLSKYNEQNVIHWQGQYKQIYTNYKNEIESANKVIITDEYAQPYIFALYYLKIHPKSFQLNRTLNPVDRWGVSLISSFDKFEFREASNLDLVRGSLIFSKSDIGEESNKIVLPNGEIALYVYYN